MTAEKLLNKALTLIPWALRGYVKRLPVIAQLQRALVSRLLDGKAFVHLVEVGPAKGVKFWVRMPEDKGIWTGTYERAFAARLAAATRPGMVAYDIGSWHGFFAGVMAAQRASVVHVFEPLPDNADRIRKLIALNPERNIILHTCAVGNSDTQTDLLIMAESSMAKLENSPFQPQVHSERRIRVQVRTIDSLIAAGEIAPPHVIKIDVEGAELMALDGGQEMLRRHHPLIFAEIHSVELLVQCTALLESKGYTIESLDEDRNAARARNVFQICASPI